MSSPTKKSPISPLKSRRDRDGEPEPLLERDLRLDRRQDQRGRRLVRRRAPFHPDPERGAVAPLPLPASSTSELLHILFNMLWLWYLGRPIEQRIGPSRYLLLTLATGIGANTIQYLMSGPFFVGYSGIVMGLAGFIWMQREDSSLGGISFESGDPSFSPLFYPRHFRPPICGLSDADFFEPHLCSQHRK